MPILYLGVILLVALRCGYAAGALGTSGAALLFAYFLFPPIGSIVVASKDARSNLAWFVLGGLACSFFIGALPVNTEKRATKA